MTANIKSHLVAVPFIPSTIHQKYMKHLKCQDPCQVLCVGSRGNTRNACPRAGDSHTNAIVGQCAEVSHAHGKTQGSCPRRLGLGVQTRPPGASGELSEPAGKGPTEGPETLTIGWRGLGGACAESDGLAVASRWEGVRAPCGQGGL